MNDRAALHTGRLVRVRLTDVPLDVRKLAAARCAATHAPDGIDGLMKAAELMRAALNPDPDAVYLLPAAAVDAARARW